MNVIRKNNVKILGDSNKAMKGTLIFAHGYGCDQSVWHHLIPEFVKDYRVVLFDLVGSGNSDLTAYDRVKYGTLHGYADDVIEMCKALELSKATFIGHSVSASIGALASLKSPALFQSLVMVAPSPCFINDDNYIGGFDRAAINQMLESLDTDFGDWAKAIVPLVIGTSENPALSEILLKSFCRNRPDIAKHFAHVTFLADHRAEMAKIAVPTAILQCTDDSLAPQSVGEFLRKTIPNSTLHVLKASGHCPHLSAPEETLQRLKAILNNLL